MVGVYIPIMRIPSFFRWKVSHPQKNATTERPWHIFSSLVVDVSVVTSQAGSVNESTRQHDISMGCVRVTSWNLTLKGRPGLHQLRLLSPGSCTLHLLDAGPVGLGTWCSENDFQMHITSATSHFVCAYWMLACVTFLWPIFFGDVPMGNNAFKHFWCIAAFDLVAAMSWPQRLHLIVDTRVQ